jgi:hypothetical protein
VDRFTDGRHAGASIEEWLFGAWKRDGSLGLLSGHRIVGRTAWYWAALGRRGLPLLHVIDDAIPVRRDPFVVKGEALWAEHTCEAPMEQWSIGNETYAAALDDPDDALGRAYGHPTPIAFDLEWYALGPPEATAGDPRATGYRQPGVVHGAIEVAGEPRIDVREIPAVRWHRWTSAASMRPVDLPAAPAHHGVRAPFAFPDGAVADLVLTPDGWRRRADRARPSRQHRDRPVGPGPPQVPSPPDA